MLYGQISELYKYIVSQYKKRWRPYEKNLPGQRRAALKSSLAQSTG